MDCRGYPLLGKAAFPTPRVPASQIHRRGAPLLDAAGTRPYSPGVNLCLYEDPEVLTFGPHALLRPVFSLRCGIFPLIEKLVRAFPESPLVLVVRPELEELTRLLYPTAHVGEPPPEETLFVNGRLCMTDDEVLHFLAAAKQEASYMTGGVLFAAKVGGPRVAHVAKWLRRGDPEKAFEELRFPAEVNGFLARSAADLIRWSPRQIVQDFRYAFLAGSVLGRIDEGARVLQPDAIHVARGARVMPGAVLNAEGGPILVGENAVIEPLAYVEGPAAIGDGSRVKAGAQIREGTSIGPVCKVGGEVEATIFQGYANKQHDGFVGHSFIGEWVNLGAGTITSNLKNTYGSVRLDLPDARIETGRLNLGTLFGDHAKTAIGTMLSTGTVVCAGANVFGAAPPKYVPPFAWGSDGRERVSEEGFLRVAERVLGRRSVEFTAAVRSSLQQIYVRGT